MCRWALEFDHQDAKDPETLGGTPVFTGTRVPVQSLMDYLEAGQPLDEFLEDFPTVTREHAVGVLEQAKDSLINATDG
ncbi:MAG: DUF433 domain-containing protein [Chloroflexi bacterium]|nr:DUF433 domain-containing protein [Chloroflexota bacterium]